MNNKVLKRNQRNDSLQSSKESEKLSLPDIQSKLKKKSKFQGREAQSQYLTPGITMKQDIMNTSKYQMTPEIKKISKIKLSPYIGSNSSKIILMQKISGSVGEEQLYSSKNIFWGEDQRFKRQLSIDSDKQIQEENDDSRILDPEQISHFNTLYKKVSRNKQKFNTQLSSNLQNLLLACEQQNILPLKFDQLPPNNQDHIANFTHYSLGDKYANVLSQGLKEIKSIDNYQLKNNRLTSFGVQPLVTNVLSFAKIIDLSNNRVGYDTCLQFNQYLKDSRCMLKQLNLENNKLTDQCVLSIYEALKQNSSLQKLRISDNLITDQSCTVLRELLIQNNTLVELYLDWNRLKAQGGILIFDGLQKNNELRVLDLSWNSLGSKPVQCAKKIAEFFKNNIYLIHLDLSHNQFNSRDSLVIGDGLVSNNTLYGLHFTGNQAQIDSNGFIKPLTQASKISGLSHQEKIDGVECKRKNQKSSLEYDRFQDKCWICEGWQEVSFQWIPGKSGLEDCDPLFIHFEFDDYKPIYIPKNSENFIVKKICPPGRIKYFYSINFTQVVDETQKIIASENPKIKNIEILKGKLVNLYVPKLNLVDVSINHDVISQYFEPNIQIKPRTPDPEYVPPQKENEIFPWQFQLSVFRDYKYDTDEVVNKCFEYDWSCCKIQKFVTNAQEVQQIKEYLQQIYRQLKEAYKYYATIGVVDQIWSIGSNVFTEFVNQCNIIDGKNVVLADVDRKFISTNSQNNDIKSKNNPEKMLIRSQFMEVLVRLAQRKYIESGEMSSYYEATLKLFQENVLGVISKFNANKWRFDKLYNEECDVVLKAYLSLLVLTYKRYSGQKTLPGKQKFMCLDEFIRLCKDLGLFEDNFFEKDSYLAFNLSIMTQVDELSSTRHIEMYFIEFLEAFGRLADKYQPKVNQPLHAKIEAIANLIKNKLIDKLVLSKLFLPRELLFQSNNNYQLNSNILILYKESNSQNVTFETSRKSLKDLKKILYNEDNFF